MTARNPGPDLTDTDFGSIFKAAAGDPFIIRVWHRLMTAMVFLLSAFTVGTLFDVFPERWNRLFGFVGASTMALLILGLAYRRRLQPRYSYRWAFGLSRQRACVVDTAAIITAACIGLLQIVSEDQVSVVAFVAMASLLVCIIAIATRPREQ